ncbi:MAG TPA: ABC transporter permease [Methylomirabilota bacterium]|nr:ABC transporter permease [Methylomirabilota bacterium]
MKGPRINAINDRLQGLGQFALLGAEVIASLVSRRLPWRQWLEQTYLLGVKSRSVVLITGAFTGMVLAAQTYFQFHKVKLDNATLAVVSVAMAKELGPVLSGLMVAGRVGAALAAELGTMRVTEQIDALRTLATDPVGHLVVPRVLATLVALPLLTVEAIVVAIGSGYALGVFFLGVHPAYSWNTMINYTGPEDPITGVLKALIFGAMVGWISCYKGLHCAEGAEGVGRATTEAVVYSSVSILISNLFLTLLLNRILANT